MDSTTLRPREKTKSHLELSGKQKSILAQNPYRFTNDSGELTALLSNRKGLPLKLAEAIQALNPTGVRSNTFTPIATRMELK